MVDQWDTVPLYERALQGVLSLRDLIAPHNEHRILLPRLIMLLDYAIDAGRNRVNLAAIMLIQAMHAALFVLICRHVATSWPLRLALSSLVIVLLFGIYQYEISSAAFSPASLRCSCSDRPRPTHLLPRRSAEQPCSAMPASLSAASGSVSRPR